MTFVSHQHSVTSYCIYLMNAFLIIFSDAILVCLGDTLVSVLAGFSVFAMLGVLSHELGTDIESVIQSG